MKSIASTLSFLFALSAFSAIEPITSFNPGFYLGSGSYRTSTGVNGATASYISFGSEGWNIIQLRNNTVHFYGSVLDIDENGFFTIQFTDTSNPAQPISAEGYGNCATNKCQFTVSLAHGQLHKILEFDGSHNLLHSYGVIRYQDGTASVQWEEDNFRLPSTK
jgi:hypothetical protein